jgi:endonuclease/exonuclease/phosphatase family metal-dependent hydrolase
MTGHSDKTDGEHRRRRGARWAPVLAAALLALVGGWWLQREVPAGPASGTELNGPPPTATAPAAFTVAAFNIHGGEGDDGRTDLARVAADLEGADLAGLNEVHWAGAFSERSQAAELGKKLGMAWRFAPTERRAWAASFGNAVLTRLPVEHWQRIPLAHSHGRAPRNILHLRVRGPDGPINVLVTHIDLRADHDEQLRTAIALFESLAPPVILMGDLNTTARDPQLADLLDRPGVAFAPADARTVTDKKRVDWIIVRGLDVLESSARDTPASDHPVVRARLATQATHGSGAEGAPGP